MRELLLAVFAQILPVGRHDRGTPLMICRERMRGCNRRKGRNKTERRESRPEGRDAAIAALGILPLLDLLLQGLNVRKNQLSVPPRQDLQLIQNLCDQRILNSLTI